MNKKSLELLITPTTHNDIVHESITFENLLEKLGINDDENRKEAQEMWAQLDKLYISDPEAYNAYIMEQARSMHEMVQRPDDCIKPEKGFAIKLELVKQSNSSFRIRSDYLFINFCKHRCIRIPHDAVGNDATTMDETIHIPLYISPLRETEDENGQLAYVVDIISNPWCYKSNDDSFMKSYIKLGIISVQDEYSFFLTNPNCWESLSYSYHNFHHGQKSDEVIDISITRSGSNRNALISMNTNISYIEDDNVDLSWFRTSKPMGKILIEEYKNDPINNEV